MKKYFARVAVVLWVIVATVTISWLGLLALNRDENTFSFLFFLIPVVVLCLALAFVLTGTISLKSMIKMSRE